jgi:hypothetical protein
MRTPWHEACDEHSGIAALSLLCGAAHYADALPQRQPCVRMAARAEPTALGLGGGRVE